MVAATAEPIEEVFHSTELANYTTISELVVKYKAHGLRAMELKKELEAEMDLLRSAFNAIGSGPARNNFECKIELCGVEEDARVEQEMKRDAWSILINKLGIRKVMSTKRRKALDDALLSSQNKYHRTNDPIDQMPPIDEENIFAVMQGYRASADEFLDESIAEEYEWIKPWRSDEYVTNRQNRWRIGRKMIKHCVGGYGSTYRPCTHDHPHLQNLDNIFHLLDGKGFPASHNGPLCDAISGLPKQTGVQFETDYFKGRLYRNGNAHIEFRRPDLVKLFNFKCGNRAQLPGDENDRFYDGGADPKDVPTGKLDYFPTPADLAAEMVEMIDVKADGLYCEPEAGCGRIADALRDAGADVECFEIQSDLVDKLRENGHNATQADWLSQPDEPRYDGIVMNPPFNKLQDCAHVMKAWKRLKVGGKLVAIMSRSWGYRNHRLAEEFREFVDANGFRWTELEAGTFKESGTNVASLLVWAEKREAKLAGPLEFLN